MRLDHLAFRVRDRFKTSKFFQDAFGYKIQQEFTIDFGEGQTADCIALEPPEKIINPCPWVHFYPVYSAMDNLVQEFHLPPEIFVSDGSPGSIVGTWVAQRNNVGGIHHLAFQTHDVKAKMEEWKTKGYAEFSTEDPITCPGLTQVFSKPSELCGVIFELIHREEFGFCKENVRALMESTRLPSDLILK